MSAEGCGDEDGEDAGATDCQPGRNGRGDTRPLAREPRYDHRQRAACLTTHRDDRARGGGPHRRPARRPARRARRPHLPGRAPGGGGRTCRASRTRSAPGASSSSSSRWPGRRGGTTRRRTAGSTATARTSGSRCCRWSTRSATGGTTLPRGHRVCALVVVHPTAEGDLALPAGTVAEELAWTRACDAAATHPAPGLPARPAAGAARGRSRRHREITSGDHREITKCQAIGLAFHVRSPDRIRTGVTALRGRRPRPLDDGAVL